MQKVLQLTERIRKQLKEDSLPLLEEINLHRAFETIYELQLSNEQTNILICAIILSYDNESKWIDLRQDGQTINKNILNGLGIINDIFLDPFYNDFLELTNENINTAIGEYLDLIIDWRFVSARKMIDYHAKYVRETEGSLTGVDDDKKVKAREGIGKLIREAINQRKSADELIRLIEMDYVNTNHRVEQDFGIKFTDTTIKRDSSSWRQFILYDYPEFKKKNHLFKP